MVFMHHPPFLKHRGEEDGYYAIPRKRRTPLLSLMRKFGVGAVFAGHWHRNSHGMDGSLEVVTSGPVGKPKGDTRSGIRIVEVFPDRLVHTYTPLGRVPRHLLPSD